jgi:hypothetical protein
MKTDSTPMMTLMTKQFFVKFSTIFNHGASIAAGLMLCLATSVAQASDPEGFSPAAIPHVGEVSLVLGRAYLQAPGQPRQRVRKGSIIKVHDQITTEANGHVHIRFVDQALMSLRPRTRLEIVRYDFNTERPERSVVKFNLIEGVTRAISGDAAKAARDRFRLNTPIAAIGVRGTDFVVSATESTTRALVNVGTIVMAPYSIECSADAFGPCTANAVELTSLSLQLIELDDNSALPRLLPAPNVRDPDMMREEVQQLIASSVEASADGPASDETYLEGVTAVKANADVERVSNDLLAPVTETPPVTPPESPPVTPPESPPVTPPQPDFTPATTVAPVELTTSQLVWGRFSSGFGEQEKITVSFATASADRKITVGNIDYGLFRPENGSQHVDSGLGVVSFSLASAQAFYSSESGVVAMQVRGGALDIDFQENRFATELNLSHSATGAVDFLASGRLFDGGYFHARTDTQEIAGAVSIDGSEAGYFFSRQLDNGNIQGLTLWGAGR